MRNLILLLAATCVLAACETPATMSEETSEGSSASTTSSTGTVDEGQIRDRDRDRDRVGQ